MDIYFIYTRARTKESSMTNYINIENLPDVKYKNCKFKLKDFANQVDARDPNVNDPNDVGDANDHKLSQREIAKVERLLTEYFTQNPEKDDLGMTVPVGKSVLDAIKTMFDSCGASYFKYQLDQAARYVKKMFS